MQGVAAAIDVLDGKTPGITDAKSLLAGKPACGASLVVRAIAIRPETRCPILKQAERSALPWASTKASRSIMPGW